MKEKTKIVYHMTKYKQTQHNEAPLTSLPPTDCMAIWDLFHTKSTIIASPLNLLLNSILHGKSAPDGCVENCQIWIEEVLICL